MSIQQTVVFKSSAEAVYSAITSSVEFAKVTGAPADIATDEGGTFSCFGGQVSGRHVELVPNERIVQAWRVGPWPDSVYSIVRFDISQSGELTTLELTHTGFPEDAADHLEGGWHKMYWEPLKAYLE
jgi:activator of HSP90 ATPase